MIIFDMIVNFKKQHNQTYRTYGAIFDVGRVAINILLLTEPFFFIDKS